MATAIARVRYLQMAPRKVRLVADLIRGKSVADARDLLSATVKTAAPPMRKVLNSAVANAESKAAETRERINSDEMVVELVKVDEGPTGRRFRPRARGRATRVRKRTSHITLKISGS
jgi:large subunit ribosomal protein L22